MIAARTRIPIATVLLLAASMAAGTAVPARAEDPPKNVKPFTRFKVIRSGILNVTLPFDVPFILWGDVPKGTTHVTLRWASAPRSTQCSSVPATAFSGGDRVATLDWLPSDYTDRGETAPSKTPDTDTLVQYEVLAPALRPGRLYCLMLQTEPGRALVESEKIQLADALVPAYEGYLERRGNALSTVADDEVEPLRRELIAAVLAADPLGGFRPLPQTEFDPEANPAAVRTPFLVGLAPVIQAYRSVLTQLAVFQFLNNDPSELVTGTARHDSLLAHWRAWRGHPDFAKLSTEAADPVRSLIASVAALTERQRANQFVGLAPDEKPTVMTGLTTFDPDYPDPAPAVPRGTDACPLAGDAAARCLQIQQLIDRLTAIRTEAAARSHAALATAIDTTIADLQEQKGHLLQAQVFRQRAHALVVQAVQDLKGTIAISIRVVATTSGSAETRRTWYISADSGIAVAPVINEVFPYVGSNIYFRPVNMDAPPGPFLTRFAALVAFTWTNNLTKPGEREALYGEDAMLVLGAGVRLTEVIRVNGGALVFKRLDPNPLLDETRLAFTPFFSVSADIDVGGLLASLFGARPAPKP